MREVKVLDKPLLVGTSIDAQIVLDDPTVSRKHAELTTVAEGLQIRDLGSRNGTYYLGNRVENITVVSGGCIVVGRTEMHVEVDSSALVTPIEGPEHYAGVIGRSPAMRGLSAMLRRLEGSLVSVLVSGESGTGKELIARAIHDNSNVSSGPFVAVNCGALSSHLAYSELFGHRRGAFTGAVENRVGAFEAAHRGTLFLDEVGELPLDVQPLLLRALQQRCIVRLGEQQERTVEVRLVTATHRDLTDAVQREAFRQDLYYRIRVASLNVPPLREREGDIELLARHFASQRGAPELPRALLDRMLAHHWPGNVRELAHAIDAYLALGELPHCAQRNSLELDLQLERHLDVDQPYEQLKREFLERFQRSYVRALLAQNGGCISQAARVSGLERSYLGKLAQRYSQSANELRQTGTRVRPSSR